MAHPAATTPADLAFGNTHAQLAQIVDQTAAAVFIKDLAGRLIFANPAFESITGLPLDAIVGQLDRDVFPSTAAELHGNDRRVAETGQAMDFEETIATAHGLRTYLSHKFPLLDESGRVCAVCGIATDISARKRVEEALRAAALAVSTVEGVGVFGELVRSLATILRVDAAMIAVFVDGDSTRMRTLAARLDGNTLRNFEYPLAGSPCRDVVGRDFRCVGSGVNREFPPGTLFAAKGMDSYAALPLTGVNGRPLGLIAAMDRQPMRDAALAEAMLKIFAVRAAAEIERTLGEAQLRQSQKMEAIGHLTGGIAHDFNNLLTSIMGYVALAAERVTGADPKLATYLDQATASCLRARDLIQQMLTFSRGGRGDPQVIALAPRIGEALRLLRASLPATVAMRMELDDDAPPVLLDPVQLEQVLMNLVINARDAMQSSGELRVTLRRVAAAAVCTSCRTPFGGEWVELAVADTGPGIPIGVQERMFEPFFTTKDAGHGSGMGLSTVHGIVHRHGGHVIVDTAPGRGAAFRMLFPAAEREATAAGEKARETVRATLSGRVAIVDDEPAVAEFMQELLGRWGLAVTGFADGATALRALEGGTAFDIVITDQTMPGMTGIAFAQAVHAQNPRLPIVLYTGHVDALASTELDRAGVRALLSKPIDAHALLEVLRGHLPVAPAAGAASD
jgi:PAS domain S-box-containing protein